MKLLHHERKRNNGPLGAHIGEEKQHQREENDSGIHVSSPVSYILLITASIDKENLGGFGCGTGGLFLVSQDQPYHGQHRSHQSAKYLFPPKAGRAPNPNGVCR